MTEQTLSVSELTRQIKFILETQVAHVHVEGELSNFKISPTGHAYFSLKDQGAQMSCVMFKRELRALNFKPEDGKQVELNGRVTVYEQRGNYQIIVEQMKEQGLGALFKAFHELKDKLEKEGLFEQDKKKEIPFLPRKIGVVTSQTGAAIQDIINVLNRRFSNLELYVYDARVQGDQAPSEIVRGIKRLNEISADKISPINLDVLIVGRGGGSIEDLWAFNDEKVARAIAASKLPIISAVGHEVDFTIADFVSDLRAPTPSAAAEIVSGNQEELLDQIKSLNSRLDYLVTTHVQQKKEQVKNLLNSYGMRRPNDRVKEYIQRVDDSLHRINLAVTSNLDRTRSQLENLNGKLSALNPTAVMQRGFSIVYKTQEGKKEEEIITNANQVKPNETLRIQTAEGDFPAKAQPPIKQKQLDLF